MYQSVAMAFQCLMVTKFLMFFCARICQDGIGVNGLQYVDIRVQQQYW